MFSIWKHRLKKLSPVYMGATGRNEITKPATDLRMTAAMRLTLAASGLLIIWMEPSEPVQFRAAAFVVLLLYTIYSLSLFLGSLGKRERLPVEVLHWLDVGWFVPLIAFTGGSNSLFFFFFFFAILVASFRWGFSSGLRVTLVSTLLFTLVSYLTPTPNKPVELGRFLLRYIDLLAVGYMIAYWGGSEVKLRSRLRLLKEVSLLSNPRFGVDQTINSVIESLRKFYGADTCLLIFVARSGDESAYRLHRVDRNRQSATAPTEITNEMARLFLARSPTQAAIYKKGFRSKMLLYDTITGLLTNSDSGDSSLVNAFEGKSFLTVPVYNNNQSLGRLYVVGGARPFDPQEMDFVLQLIEQVVPVLENIRLVDRLASEAAEQERRKIAQDIHDTVIQPYIGLQFGLEAVRQKLEGGNHDVLGEVKDLLELTNGEIGDLRSYVGGLRRGESASDSFLPAVQRFAAKFSEATGLQIEVSAAEDLPIYDRLAAELFKMIEEGLSNIRRHSSSRYAKVDITSKNGDLIMELRNQRAKNLGSAVFTPRSIADRAAALGGQAFVYTNGNNETVVSVQIPL